MVYRVRTFSMTPSVGGAISQEFTEWMKKVMQYTNKTWPEVEAEYLMTVFEGPEQSFASKHDTVEASIEWYRTFFNDEGMRKLMEELQEIGKKNGSPAFQSFSDSFYRIIE